MSVLETKYLLRKNKIVPNRLLGQNFMVEPLILPKLGYFASLNRNDVVLDAGAGFGFLTSFMADRCRMVVAVEKDPVIVAVLREQLKDLANVTVIEGDVLKVAIPKFTKVVSIPPYYLSSRLVLWLLDRGFDCAVLILQKEFAKRLNADVGSNSYGWLSVVTFHSVKVELLDVVPKSLFHPPPEVDSVIVRLSPWNIEPFEVKNEVFFRRMVQWLFTQRNKKLGNALLPFIRSTFKITDEDAKKLVYRLSYREKRARELSPEAFGDLANALVS
jgi:16S rRNA (adenine1518-N6/adenine1519-N6)-dimethyltransferase